MPMARLRLSAFALLAGCDGVLGLVDIMPRPDGPPPPDAPTTVPCASDPDLNDDFVSTVPCAPLGGEMVGNGGMMDESVGTLTITPQANQGGSFGRCDYATPIPLMPGGVFIKMPTVLSMTGSSYVMLNALSKDNGRGGKLLAQFGNVKFQDPATLEVGGSIPYDQAMAQWWRIRPNANAIVGEVSPDTVTWQLVGTLAGTPTASVEVMFEAGESGGDLTPGFATFQRLDLCP